MRDILRQIARIGIRSERLPPPGDEHVLVNRLQQTILSTLGRALTIRQVDAGSCNACELEIHALLNPMYNIEGLGIRFVASPRHADMLLVTGPVSRHMAVALQRTYDATPEPKLVVAVGNCGCTGGIFGESYASLGRVGNVIPVDVEIPGCPPTPAALLAGILAALRAGRVEPEASAAEPFLSTPPTVAAAAGFEVDGVAPISSGRTADLPFDSVADGARPAAPDEPAARPSDGASATSSRRPIGGGEGER